MRLRIAIADDEPAARRRLRRFLQSQPDCDIVAEYSDGASLLRSIPESAPDLLFLDVRMPELDGLSALSRLPAGNRPVVVFTTAHADYAVGAFEIEATDYLLKPFDQNRFETALARAQARLAQRGAGRVPEMDEPTAEPAAQPAIAETLLVKSRGRILVLKTDQVDWIEAAGKYVRLHAEQVVYLLREPLHRLADRLDSRKFVRIHRSTIVNFERVREFQPAFHGDFQVVLHDGTELILSRSFRAAVEARLGQPL